MVGGVCVRRARRRWRQRLTPLKSFHFLKPCSLSDARCSLRHIEEESRLRSGPGILDPPRVASWGSSHQRRNGENDETCYQQ